MNFVNKYGKGILVCLLIAIPSWIIGKMFPVIGGAVIAILAGMIIAMFWNDKGKAEAGIKWTSKIVLQTAVVSPKLTTSIVGLFYVRLLVFLKLRASFRKVIQ